MLYGDDDDGGGSACSSGDEFMSPFAPLRATFPTPQTESKTSTLLDENVSSIIVGEERVCSPIDFDDDTNEDFAIIEPYRKALNDSIESSSYSYSNERTSLLGRRSVSHRSRSPLWNSNPERGDSKQNHDSHAGNGKETSTRLLSRCSCSCGTVLCTMAGIHLACMAMHDWYLWYLSYRLGNDSGGDGGYAWRLPLVSPTTNTLLRFGAWCPTHLVLYGQPWRILTSIPMCTSLVEYVLMTGAWHVFLRGLHPTGVGLYLMSTMSGQLWTMAWDPYSVSGGATWGTCGVLCAVGAANPRERFPLLLLSTLLFGMSLLDTSTNSFLVALGSIAFGCAYYGVGNIFGFASDSVRASVPTKSVRTLSAVWICFVWMTPLLWLVFGDSVVTAAREQQHSYE